MERASLACLIVLFAASAYAAPHARGRHRARRVAAAKAKRAYFLAGDPHVPLAVVRDGRIGDGEFDDRHCGAHKRWKRLGTRWTALDAWGQRLGVFTATSKDDYDVTGCAELSFAPALADDSSHVFVSVDSAWRPPRSVAWAAPASRRASLAALAKSRIDDARVRKDLVWSQCTSISERTRFFHVPGRGEWAVATSNTGWLVARAGARGWAVRSFDRARVTAYSAVCFRPVAVFDMNGDGTPEIVMRSSGGDGWNDFVLALGRDDRWHVVAASRGGSTA